MSINFMRRYGKVRFYWFRETQITIHYQPCGIKEPRVEKMYVASIGWWHILFSLRVNPRKVRI